jgi:hypothetical protein
MEDPTPLLESRSVAGSLKEILTSLLVFAFCVLLVVLYLANKSAWQHDLAAARQEADSLRNMWHSQSDVFSRQRQGDSLRAKLIYDNYYDPAVENDFRLYGLYKDKAGTYTIQTLARRFNISNENSIKSSEVAGEKWYIVPVKGVHLVLKGESAGSIARLYYFNPADSALIRDFNGVVRPGKMVFIPFN